MSSISLSFVSERDRDAWGAILGFLYQVELSVLRLLDLGPDDILELERGEDIDIIAGALAADAPPDALGRVTE